MLKVFLENVIRDSVTYTEHARRKRSAAMGVATRSSARAARSTALAGKSTPRAGRRAAADQDQRWLLDGPSHSHPVSSEGTLFSTRVALAPARAPLVAEAPALLEHHTCRRAGPTVQRCAQGTRDLRCPRRRPRHVRTQTTERKTAKSSAGPCRRPRAARARRGAPTRAPPPRGRAARRSPRPSAPRPLEARGCGGAGRSRDAHAARRRPRLRRVELRGEARPGREERGDLVEVHDEVRQTLGRQLDEVRALRAPAAAGPGRGTTRAWPRPRRAGSPRSARGRPRARPRTRRPGRAARGPSRSPSAGTGRAPRGGTRAAAAAAAAWAWFASAARVHADPWLCLR